MNTTWDLLISSFIGGILLVAVFSLNANLMHTGFETTRDDVSQTQLLGFTQLMEYDFNKIGYRASSPKITIGDSTEIIFKSDIANNHVVHMIRYITGAVTEGVSTQNPNDFPLYRYIDGTKSLQNYYGLTYFRFTYYDSTGTKIGTPVTATNQLNRIKSIKVQAVIQSFYKVDSTYASCYWERTFFPKNIQ
jgi:hypothetical protein